VANVMLPHQYCPELLAKCACRRYWIVDNIPFLWHPDSLKVIPPQKKARGGVSIYMANKLNAPFMSPLANSWCRRPTIVWQLSKVSPQSFDV